MSAIKDLEPKAVWKYFEEITKIPRPSKREEKIIEYLLNFGKKYHLETKKDEAGNVLIRKNASKGKEGLQSVVLQGHMDMVCEKNSDKKFDFDNDPIEAFVDGDWVKANGTTLGADDGIGMAMQLALLSLKDIEHGPLECLFTTDEETGMTGAKKMLPDFFESKILINLDSEDENEICIGCAGGLDTTVVLNYKTRKTPKDSIGFKISIGGLMGGHSGDVIDKGHGNSIKILTRILWNISSEVKIRLASFDGGNLRNAIPREAFAIITTKEKNRHTFHKLFDEIIKTIKKEILHREPEIKIIGKEIDNLPACVMKSEIQGKLLNALYASPHGAYTLSKEMQGLVETSTNLASVKHKKNNQIVITFLSRSSVDSLKHDLSKMIESTFLLANACVTHSGAYPGWAPDTKSGILQIATSSFKKNYNKLPKIFATHGGLECGLLLEKYPGLDMISIGPTLIDVHSPNERINIKSVQNFWPFLINILSNIPHK